MHTTKDGLMVYRPRLCYAHDGTMRFILSVARAGVEESIIACLQKSGGWGGLSNAAMFDTDKEAMAALAGDIDRDR